MEKMPYRVEMDAATIQLSTETVMVQPASEAARGVGRTRFPAFVLR